MLILGEVTAPEDGVRLIQDQVVAYLNDQAIAGDGTLVVAESRVTWVSRTEGGKGFSLSYPSIVMHAISTDCSSFPHEHVLVVVDAARAGGSRGRRRARDVPLYTEDEAAAARDVNVAQQELRGGDGEGAEEDDDASEDGNLLLRFVPSDLSALNTIYNEMAACQELNPDEDDEASEDEDDMEGGGGGGAEGFEAVAGGDLGPGWFTAANLNEATLSEEGRANLERIMRNSNGHENGHDGTNGHDPDESMEQE